MSYNGSGTFVINSTGQPVVTGTVISSSTFNSLTADLGTGLSTAITKDGQTTTTAKIPFALGISAAVASNFAAGTVAAPSIYLSTDTGTGFYRIGANNNGYAVSGTKLLDFSSALLAVTGALTVSTTINATGAITGAAGSFTTLTASGDIIGATVGVTGSGIPITGIYKPGSSILGFSIATANRATLGALSFRVGATGTGVELWDNASIVPATNSGSGIACNGSTMALAAWSGVIGLYAGNDGAIPVKQVEIVATASASRYLKLTGSNGGNPSIDVSAGALAITPAVVMASTLSAGATSVTGTLGVTGAVTLAGATASAWTTYAPIQAEHPAISGHTELLLGSNVYYDGAFKYVGARTASSIILGSATGAAAKLITMNVTATTGTANGAITFVEALSITKDGAVAIPGTLGVTGTTTVGTASAGQLVIIGPRNNTAALRITANAGESWDFTTTNTTGSTDTLSLGVQGGSTNITFTDNGTNTMPAYGAGAATFSAAGVISSVSDETWKIKDGIPTDPDAMLHKLAPGYWFYNEEKRDTFGKDRQLGFYAQNVNAAIGPEAAPEPEEGKPWGYYDRSVLAVAVMSLQSALTNIQTLSAKVAALEAR